MGFLRISALLQCDTQVLVSPISLSFFSPISLSVPVYGHLAEVKKSWLPGIPLAPGFYIFLW